MSYNKNSRLEKKFIVTKASGEPVDPKADYLVLRIDNDPAAQAGALAFANAVYKDAPELAMDIITRVYRYMKQSAQNDEDG